MELNNEIEKMEEYVPVEILSIVKKMDSEIDSTTHYRDKDFQEKARNIILKYSRRYLIDKHSLRRAYLLYNRPF